MRINPVTSSRCITVRRAPVSLFNWLLLVLGHGAAMVSVAAEVAITKSVDDPTLMPGAAVEFTVTVENRQTVPAEDVVVSDRLPEGLEIPVGIVPFASQGIYEIATGVWSVGTLPPSAEAVLQIPALVNADPLPPCIINRAVVQGSGEFGVPSAAASVLRRPNVERCIDLELNALNPPPNLVVPCTEFVEVPLFVNNLGPDDARGVVIRLEDSPNQPPGLGFIDTVCETNTECTLESLAAGEVFQLTLISNPGITNSIEREFDVAITASVAEPDYNVGQASVYETFTKLPYTECNYSNIPSIFGSGGGGGCFIATAAYGSPMHPYVEVLGDWRDRVLLTNAAGRAFVNLYYRYSPPLADYIAERPGAKSVARVLLWPIVVTILHPLLVGTIVFVVTIGLIFRRRRRAHVA